MEWQLTPIFLPEESHGERSLAGYSPRGHRIGHNLSDYTTTKGTLCILDSPNKRASKHMLQKSTALKRKTHKSTIIVEEFYTTLLIADETAKQKS